MQTKLSKIYPYLNNLTDHEVAVVRAAIKSLLNNTVPPEYEKIPNILNDRQYSLPYKTLTLALVKLSRHLVEMTSNSSKRIDILRDLKQLMAHLDHTERNKSPKYEASENEIFYNSISDQSLVDGIRTVYSVSVGRYPVGGEIRRWTANLDNGLKFHEFLLAMFGSDEAKSKGKGVLLSLNDGEFIQSLYELVLGRGARAWEIDYWRERLESGLTTRTDLLGDFFNQSYQTQTDLAHASPYDGLSCTVLGTSLHFSVKDWEDKAAQLTDTVKTASEKAPKYPHRFFIQPKRRVLISALASLYNSGEFIEQFMANITGQDGFEDYCELIIVDADSPDDEYTTIKKYLLKFKNVNYIRCNYRIGIYDAWNVAVKAAKGLYLTNTNMDDLRRHDSLLLQAGVLDNLKFVDVVYQDLYYTFNPSLSFDEIADFNVQTKLPLITPHNMLDYNSPHNAPMWRKCLHDELGYFETRYRSAGDYEFWLRCLAAGKRFYKINDPHVAYYQNPKGISTRPDTRGLEESLDISKRYARQLITAEVTMPREHFISLLSLQSGGRIEDTGDRYNLVQQALRNTARTEKYTVNLVT